MQCADYRQPFMGEHHTCAPVHLDNMMIVIPQLCRLFARANGNRLVGIDLIEGSGHPVFILQVSNQ